MWGISRTWNCLPIFGGTSNAESPHGGCRIHRHCFPELSVVSPEDFLKEIAT